MVIGASAAFTLWVKFAAELDVSWPAKLVLMAGPAILLAAIPTAWLLNKLEEKH
ncbi:hypothetical protein D3C75_1306330 [compost metagenome]